jgi:hypothetical protein
MLEQEKTDSAHLLRNFVTWVLVLGSRGGPRAKIQRAGVAFRFEPDELIWARRADGPMVLTYVFLII